MKIEKKNQNIIKSIKIHTGESVKGATIDLKDKAEFVKMTQLTHCAAGCHQHTRIFKGFLRSPSQEELYRE